MQQYAARVGVVERLLAARFASVFLKLDQTLHERIGRGLSKRITHRDVYVVGYFAR